MYQAKKIGSMLSISILLTSCSSIQPKVDNFFAPITNRITAVSSNSPEQPVASGPIGGNIFSSMDENDKEKLWHALDNPLGKSTSWKNGLKGITYTATPIAKTSVGSNQFCRVYKIASEKDGNTKEVRGTACVDASTGSWQPAS